MPWPAPGPVHGRTEDVVVSSVRPVPESDRPENFSLRSAWAAVRTRGPARLLRASFERFRYGDGFSHSRALGLQIAMAAVPLAVAAVAWTSVVGTPSLRRVLLRTVLELTPGASDPLIRTTLTDIVGNASDEVGALFFGLATGTLSITTAMGQLERGANRVYGIHRDRPTRAKYGRALLMAACAGAPAMAGFVLLVTTDAFAEAIETVYGIDAELALVLAWPAGVLLLLVSVTIMLRFAPRRRQPSWSFLAAGSVVALILWTALTALLAGALHVSAEMGNIYGPLTGVLALLLWVQLTAAAVFFACALCAELELSSRIVHAGDAVTLGTPIGA